MLPTYLTPVASKARSCQGEAYCRQLNKQVRITLRQTRLESCFLMLCFPHGFLWSKR